jgi:hypothetical protein
LLAVVQSPSSGTFACAGSGSVNFPTYTVRNIGGGVLSWSATTNGAKVTVSPANGNVVPGAPRSVQLSGDALVTTLVVTFKSNGGGATFKVACKL